MIVSKCTQPTCFNTKPCPLHPTVHYTNTERIRGRRLQRIRGRMFEQSGFRCAMCKTITSDLQLDHIVPMKLGGTNSEENLQPLCRTCHAAKSRTGGRS